MKFLKRIVKFFKRRSHAWVNSVGEICVGSKVGDTYMWDGGIAGYIFTADFSTLQDLMEDKMFNDEFLCFHFNGHIEKDLELWTLEGQQW